MHANTAVAAGVHTLLYPAFVNTEDISSNSRPGPAFAETRDGASSTFSAKKPNDIVTMPALDLRKFQGLLERAIELVGKSPATVNFSESSP